VGEQGSWSKEGSFLGGGAGKRHRVEMPAASALRGDVLR
jgi:hypothetical protein